jgi:hypothetical protein
MLDDAYYDRYEAKNKARNRAFRATHPTYAKEYYAKHIEQDRERIRKGSYMRNYGITIEQYDQMYAQQRGNCAICGDHYDVLHIDHRHGTDIKRGLLCADCNHALGLVYDSTAILQKMIHYLSAKAVWSPMRLSDILAQAQI